MNNDTLNIFLNNLIEKKFYISKEAIMRKLDILYAGDRLNDEEYGNLVMKANEVYDPKPIPEVDDGLNVL